MPRIYMPSCKNPLFYPQASEKLKKYLFEKNFVNHLTGCCKPSIKGYRNLSREDDLIVLCNTCYAVVEEHEPVQSVVHVFNIIVNDPSFHFPDYGGEKITIQDCWRVTGRHDLQNSVRSLLRKMNMEPVELEESHDRSRFCGVSLFAELPQETADLAPQRFGAHEHGIFVPRLPEEQKALMVAHVAKIITPRVVSYCSACDGGLKEGGADSVALLNLLFRLA